MTCPRCADLQEQVAYLRSEPALSIEEERISLTRRALRVSPQEARLLLVLYDSKRVMSKAALEERLPLLKTEERYIAHNGGITTVLVCRIRARLGKDAVVTEWGLGFKLSEAGRALIATALSPLARAA